MAANKITARLQTPADSSGTRKDVHLVTTDNEVLVDADTANSRNLETKLQEMRTVISKSKPKPDAFKSSFVWFKILSEAELTTLNAETMTNNVNNNTGTGMNTNLSI